MIPGLDGIRAIAILLVFFLHADYVYIGWVGVQLFFVLSGFLITDILLRMKKTESGGDFFKKFYGRRFLRIFPLYYLYLALMLAVTAILLHYEYRVNYMQLFQGQSPYAFVYGYNLFNASAAYTGESRLIGHLWSRSTEEQFYILWPLVLFLTPKKHLKKLFLAAMVFGPLFRLGITALYRFTDPTYLYDNMGVVIYVLPFSQVDAFALGAWITQFNFPKAKQQFFILLALLPVVGYATQYYSTGALDTASALGFLFPLKYDLKQVWGYFYLNYLFALLIYLVVREKMFLRLLETKTMRHLGKISYGLYVYHYAIIWFVARIRDLDIPEHIAKPLTLVISAALVYLAASLTEGAEFVVHAFVAAVDLADVADGGFPLGGKRGQQKRHPRADIGTFEFLAEQLAWSLNQAAIRVAQNDSGAHPHQFVGKVHAPGIHPIVEQHRPSGLCRDGDGNAHQIGGKGRPDIGFDLRDDAAEIGHNFERLVDGDDQVIAIHLPRDAQTVENLSDHLEVIDPRVANANPAARHHRRADEADHFQIIGANRELAAVQTVHALDMQGVRADVFDARTQSVQETAQFLDVRLGSRISDDRDSFRAHRRHDGIFGGGDARLVQ